MSRRLEHRDSTGTWQRRFDWSGYGSHIVASLAKALLRRSARHRAVRQHLVTLPGRRLRVLHVIPNVFVGGSTQLVIDLIERLGHRYEMHVLTSAAPPGGPPAGMIVHLLAGGTQPCRFRDVMASFDPDLVHVHYWGDIDTPWYAAAFAAAAASRAVIVENVNTPVAPLVDPRIARYIFVSAYVLNTFAPGLDNAAVVHPGTDLRLFRRPETVEPGADDSVGVICRLSPDKLDATALDPLILVARKRPHTRIIVIGDGPLFASFVARVESSGQAGNFEFTGEVSYDTLPTHFRRFRVFMSPVARESFGQLGPMAMATGHAVVGMNVGALSEILGSTDTLAESVESLADLIVSLLEDPERVDCLSRQNSNRVERFGVDDMIRRYRQIYGEALACDLDLTPGLPPAELFADF